MKRKSPRPRSRDVNRSEGSRETLGKVTPDGDLTWLLHRAAQQMRATMGEQIERHGINLRDYIVLSALGHVETLTQLELGQVLSLDKTTLTSQLDRLEERGFVVRRADPHDRRSRIPRITAAGRTVRAKVAAALVDAERALLARFPAAERRALRLMLCELVEQGEKEVAAKGSCL